MLKGSWKTTTSGVLTLLVAIGGAGLYFLKTGQLPPLEPLIAQIILGLGQLFARDNNVTSEEAGAK